MPGRYLISLIILNKVSMLSLVLIKIVSIEYPIFAIFWVFSKILTGIILIAIP
jgi:hypothetical protein